MRSKEWDRTKTRTFAATGNESMHLVTFVLTGGQFGLEAGYVAMGLSALDTE